MHEGEKRRRLPLTVKDLENSSSNHFIQLVGTDMDRKQNRKGKKKRGV